MKKRILSVILIVVLIMSFASLGSFDAKAAAAKAVSEDTAQSNLNELINALSGKYFTVNQKACSKGESGHGCKNCGMINVIKEAWLRDTVKRVPTSTNSGFKHYYYDTSLTRGQSCCGFANFAGWYIFSANSSDIVRFSKLKDGSFNGSTMSIARPGDVLRFGDVTSKSKHSAVFVSTYSDGIVVLDCNWNIGSGNCKVQKHKIAYNKYKYVTISRADNYIINGNTGDAGKYDVVDFNATGIVRCIEKRVFSEPISSSNQTRTIYENETINIVGYVHNSNGDVFYKTDKGDFVHNIYFEITSYEELPPSNYCVAKMKVMCNQKTVRDYPDSSSAVRATVNKGDVVDVVGYIYNTPGNLWYSIKVGTGTAYIHSSYLAVVSSDRRTPSDYADTQLEVLAAEKGIYDSPKSNSNRSGEYIKGEVFNTIGYVYNQYGNLWYVNDSGKCIYSSYLKSDPGANLPSNYDSIELRADSGKIYKSRPYDLASTSGNFNEGTTAQSIGYVINLFGNKWYECSDGLFIYDSNLSPAKYIISYNANGGNGNMANTIVKHGESITFKDCTFTKSEYEFTGWTLYRIADGKWHTEGHGWQTAKEIENNGYSKSVYRDRFSGTLDYSWANGCSNADEFILYAIWERASHTHSYTAAVTAPTCTLGGYTMYTCSCGNSYKDTYVDALGHNYVSGVCTRCNAKDPNYQAPHTHSYTAAVTAPTCTAAGYTTYTCSVCNDSYKGSYTDSLGHSYVGGVCTRCGAKDPDYKPAVSFVDVPSDAFYANAVKWAVENEITTGVGNNRFDPNGQCTRGQVVTFLWRAAGKPIVSTNVSFSDVQPGAFYYEAVKWAVANGITTGVGGNRFAPNDSCTRGQVVTFLHRAENSPGVSSMSSFADVPSTAFYYNAVNWAVANGITNGTGNGRFSPNDTCTRAQVVTFLYRAQ